MSAGQVAKDWKEWSLAVNVGAVVSVSAFEEFVVAVSQRKCSL